MNTIRRTTWTLLAAVVLVVVPALLSAHEVTHNGTVVALKTAKYAQPSGGTREVRELEVAVVDPKTKKVANRVFTITDKTKITRSGGVVALERRGLPRAPLHAHQPPRRGCSQAYSWSRRCCSSGQRLSVASSISRRLVGRGSAVSA